MALQIGDIELKYGLMLAPMAGVSDRAFRLLCREYGAEFCFTEMVSAKAVQFRDKKTFALAHIEKEDMPCALQLFGAEPDVVAQSASYLMQNTIGAPPCSIDINMGCPVRKIVSNGEGSALMRNPKLAGQIIRQTVQAVPVPVSVKIRAGWDETKKNAVSFALMAQENGASFVTVHGRTRSQMYAPPVDWEIIKQVKESLSIPVIGNGGIFCAQDALNMLAYTKCDGVMVARGAMGNPFLFAEIQAALAGKAYEAPDLNQRMETAKRHLLFMLKEKADAAIFEFRKHAAWYTKGIKGAAALRHQLNTAGSQEEILELLERIKKTGA
ncbi:MAG: tRNA dihydrouridine synthase DusB [Clostridiales bacterium]|nr:tRNA dihydrouridine synthase DusB [Clostridiales bacterium]